MLKFGISKNDGLFCHWCGSNILYGEHYIALFLSIKGEEGKIRRSRFFHVDKCYLAWREESFNDKYEYWKSFLTEPKKRGRPKVYQDGKEVHRVKSLLTYHRSRNNEDKVLELRNKLIAISSGSPGNTIP